MKTSTRLLAPLLAVLLVAGCGHVHPDGTPVSKQEDALIGVSDSYTFLIAELDAALRAHLVTVDDVRPYLPCRDAVRAALDRGNADVAVGNLSDAQIAADEAAAALVKLQPLAATLAAKKGKH